MGRAPWVQECLRWTDALALVWGLPGRRPPPRQGAEPGPGGCGKGARATRGGLSPVQGPARAARGRRWRGWGCLTGPPLWWAVHALLGGCPVPRSGLRVPSPLLGNLACRPQSTRFRFPPFTLDESPGVSGHPWGPRKPLVTGPPARWGGQWRTESFSSWVPQRRSGMPAPHPVALRSKHDVDRGALRTACSWPLCLGPRRPSVGWTSGDEQVRASACP